MVRQVKEWEPGAGRYTRPERPRVLVGAEALDEVAELFAEDLAAVVGGPVEVLAGEPEPGDVVLELGPTDLGDEGYTLTVGSWITVRADTATGVFRGTRTVLPMLRERELAAGTARDWPRRAVRGLMVDVGRKDFSLGWLRDRVRELADLNLNHLHLHLSDDQGFRVESDTCPEAVSPVHYSKAEVRELIEFARRRRVTVLPEIDMPGHMGALLAGRPHLALTNKHGVTATNLAHAESWDLAERLIAEYLPLFPGPWWHLGADEYVIDGVYPELARAARERYGPDATPKDLFYGFVNWAAELVRQGGRQPVIWNDEVKTDDGTVPLDKSLTIDYWSNRGPTPARLAADGHELFNSSFTALYYVLGDLRPRQDGWHSGVFDGGHVLPPELDDALLGAKLHVWCDTPDAETEEQVAEGIAEPLRVTARATW
ncbi:beta-N-acetylhexosaminidase [Actinophytocola gossypii]|uniref:Beta-N-acetylhexosaminidase n=1 Tax=Actinophytocola gossypii TaxID=2812003 RepID=A0ABT2JHP1_9PSEU|nr:beta-N-acetylhexosaminidase [Actinophytocola gossypii]MCT2586915.1 beta-N-acetylhexosaminidase [Actinophytocola gossypii]